MNNFMTLIAKEDALQLCWGLIRDSENQSIDVD